MPIWKYAALTIADPMTSQRLKDLFDNKIADAAIKNPYGINFDQASTQYEVLMQQCVDDPSNSGDADNMFASMMQAFEKMQNSQSKNNSYSNQNSFGNHGMDFVRGLMRVVTDGLGNDVTRAR